MRAVMRPNLKLKSLRVEKQLTQSDVAKMLKVSKNYYAKCENGIKVFSFEETLDISRIFGMSLREIFDGYFDGFLCQH